MGRFGQCNGPFWTMFLEIKIFGAVLVGAVLAMGRFGIDPYKSMKTAQSQNYGWLPEELLLTRSGCT